MHTAPTAVALTCALSFALAQDAATKDAAAKAPHAAAEMRDAVKKAIAWIEKQAVPVGDNKVEGQADAVTFPSSQEQPETRPAIVYGGAAGVLIFLENAAKVLGDAH